jgi:hypothetical protein
MLLPNEFEALLVRLKNCQVPQADRDLLHETFTQMGEVSGRMVQDNDQLRVENETMATILEAMVSFNSQAMIEAVLVLSTRKQSRKIEPLTPEQFEETCNVMRRMHVQDPSKTDYVLGQFEQALTEDDYIKLFDEWQRIKKEEFA